jgi:starch phosphorylase
MTDTATTLAAGAASRNENTTHRGGTRALADFIHEPRIAYFSMEMALRDDIPTYSGGLGVLAGDTMRSGADLDLPLIAVTLVSRAGYFRQELDPLGRQKEHPAFWDPAQRAVALGAKVVVEIEAREVWVRGWLYVLEGHMGGAQPVVLLDTDLDENDPRDREITHFLYGGDRAYRLKQEIVLGIGGVRMLHALGVRVRQFHMNEGHAALLALELLRRSARSTQEAGAGNSPYDIARVRELCNFTTHTPVEAGHDQFPYDLVQRVLGDFIDHGELKKLAGEERLNMTRLALNLSEYVNGVAKRHAEVSRQMFPGYRVRAVTNGVHPYTWTCPSFRQVYDAFLPGWCHEPELLVRVDQIPDDKIWAAHQRAKQALIDKVQALCGTRLSSDLPIVGFARRMTAYKRPDLLFADLDRLRGIAKRRPFQIVLAGKAHPHDEGGKQLIELLHAHLRALADSVPMAFLPDYGMALSQLLVSGVDVWLNTPLRPLEASGTSGMKAAFNGVPNLSVLDGWWIEGCIEGVTGWAIGRQSETDQTCAPSSCIEGVTGLAIESASASGDADDAAALYDKLENKVLPLYGKNVDGWIAVMKGAIGKNAYFFNSHRMMRRYATEAYIR